MRITVLGSGYVGLTHAAVLSHVGHQVLCMDTDSQRIQRIQEGCLPFFEPGLDDLVKTGIEQGTLQFSTDPREAVQSSEYIFICVGTPPNEDGSADMSYVRGAALSVATYMDSRKVVINKSTVPVGTADQISQWIGDKLASRGKALAFEVCSNPEFLREGSAVTDALKPDRIIIGARSEGLLGEFRRMYDAFNRNHEKIMFMDSRSAELTKYAANAMLATKISFINEIANIAEVVGADIELIRKGIGSDPRIGFQFIYPGIGFGGSCFPKDVRALTHLAMEHSTDSQILSSVNAINQRQKRKVFDLITARFGTDLSGHTIALWGLSFKPNTDDMREAPSITLIEAILAAGGKIKAYDPKAMAACERILGKNPNIEYSATKEAAMACADCLAICTEWRNFWSPDFEEVKDLLRSPIIFDGRNLYDPGYMRELGIEYFGVGRGLSVRSEITRPGTNHPWAA